MQVDSANPGPPANPPAFAGLSAVPLFHAAWLFAAGIVIAHWLWLRPGLLLIALFLVAVLCILAALRAQRIAILPVAFLWVLLGAFSASMEIQPAPAPALATLSDGLLRTVEGTIIDAGPVRGEIEQNLPDPDEPTGPPAEESPSQRIDLHVSTLEVVDDTQDIQSPTTGGVRLTIHWAAGNSAPQPFQCGDRVRAVVRLLQPETYHDPGVWSRTDYLLAQNITSTATLRSTSIERISSSPARPLACRIRVLQQASSASLLALPLAMRRLPPLLRLSQDDAIMLAAMVTGDRTYLTHTLRIGFERTGSFHMLVVSGFHLAIVTACFFWLARRLRLPRVPATLLTIAASFAYALFTGFATPVQRSLWMVTLYLLGRLLYRERSPLNTIGLASLCLLAASPRSLFEGSLQMTILAVVAIAGIAAPLLQSTIHPYLAATRDLRLVAIDAKLSPPLAQFRVTFRMLAAALQAATNPTIAWKVFPWSLHFIIRLAELLTVSCVVELAMTLPMAVYFHRITIFALPVNLFILPLLLVLMPAALITLIAAVVWPAAAVVPAMFVALPLHFGTWLVRDFGALTLGDLRIPAPLLIQSAAFCLLLAAAIILAYRSLLGAPGPASGTWEGSTLKYPHSWTSAQVRLLTWAALVLAAAAAVLPRPINHPHDALLMEAIDVGQGDSLLLITPDGKSLLVDGGGFGGGPRQSPQASTDNFDIGEEVVSEVLWSRGIRHLDAVALTHAHSDHMGGLPAVLRNFHPDELWVGNNPRFGAYNDLLSEAAGLHVRIRSFHAGDAISFGESQIAVLAPFPGYQTGPEPTNNDSLVLHMTYGATSVMLEGDAEAPVEQGMLAEPDLASTLLKVGHHGSVTSTRPEFLARIAPQWAIISCGLHNRYGHPRQEVLDELQAAHVRTYRTDLNGAVCFLLNGKSVSADPSCASQQAR
jgi:competence protein ComEC